MSDEKNYYLGTHDAEIRRLGLQHRVWRPHVLDAWRRAGIAIGSTVIDAGAGPGYASLDLAEIVEEDGKVIALERSERFVKALSIAAMARGLANIETQELDLVEDPIPAGYVDAGLDSLGFCVPERSHLSPEEAKQRYPARRCLRHP